MIASDHGGRFMTKARSGIRGVATMAAVLAGGAMSGLGVGAPPPAGATTINFGSPVWTVGPLNDASGPIALSSPTEATLPGGPAVVVGDEAGNVYAYNLASGAPVWTYNTDAPINSSPSVAPTTAGSTLDSVFVGTGDAGSPTAGGYQAVSPSGGDQWFVQETNPATDGTAHNGVQASMAVGDLQSGVDVVAGSLGENEYAMTTGSGGVLGGFPWYQGDSNFSTPALADLYGNGQTEIVEGGASSAGNSYTTPYANGGHIRVLAPTGNAGQPKPNGGLICQYTTNEAVQSSPAVGQFLGGSAVGIVVGTGSTFNQSNTDQVLALNANCGLQWTATLNGYTNSSPALADVLGNGQLQVVEGTDNGRTGSVYALNGANGSVAWSTSVGRVIGSVVTADLGSGYQDVLAPTVNGVVVLDGKTGNVITTLQSDTGFQNSPLITKDPNGTIGITLAGYQGSGSFIYHYEIAGSNGSVVNEQGAWPQFHHDAQLTGNAGTPPPVVNVACTAPADAPNGYYLSASDGGIFSYGNLPFCGSTGNLVLNQPVVGMAVTSNSGGYWEVAKDGGIFAFGNAQFYGSMGGKPLNQPVVGMAANPNGNGYWEVAADGGIFSFGTAPFYGSTGNIALNQPIVGMAVTPDGKGYWLVARDGGIFSFGDAKFYGSMGGKPLNQPIVGMAVDGSTGGYWMVAADGGVFSFDAPFYGSMGGQPLNQPIVGMESSNGGLGYRFVAADGGIFDYGTAQFYGSMGGKPLNKPIVAMAGF
jgi:outer membrane protein assembly factor BamB